MSSEANTRLAVQIRSRTVQQADVLHVGRIVRAPESRCASRLGILGLPHNFWHCEGPIILVARTENFLGHFALQGRDLKCR